MSRGFKIVLLIFLFLIVLFFVGGVAPWMLDLVFRLGFGWVNHAITVLPRVTVNWSGVGMMAVCLALAAVIGHRFCGWLWQSAGHLEPWRPRWTAAGLGIVVLMFGAGMAFTAVAHQTGWLLRSNEPFIRSQSSNDRNASVTLKTIATAQADFRANDRDGNQINDFWRKDIAGLYASSESIEKAIKLIELSVAAADVNPVSPIDKFAEKSPRAGFWFKALQFRGETTPDPNRFAALAFPVSPASGRWYFIVSEEGTIYRKPVNDGPPPEVYPDDPLKEGWSKLD